ncbi:MAG: hypothetical protein DRP06_03630 [Candidatus Aenigmatarchaeota archaeon]|nr:MAG: hypothetical protein DRP06_03630 [Candidatus Aenigmarchaeota archaeon]
MILPLTFLIDLITLIYHPLKKLFKCYSDWIHRKELRYSPKPIPASKKEVSVIISSHGQKDIIEDSVRSIFRQNYPVKNVYISDSNIDNTEKVVKQLEDVMRGLKREFPDIHYWSKEGITSKAEKINALVRDPEVELGDYVYLVDSGLKLYPRAIEKLVEGFTEDNLAAVTSYGFVTPSGNYFSKYFHYGKEWVNRLGKFRKTAQSYRRGVFVVCGASFMIKLNVLKKIKISIGTKTEDTAYTWQLQEEGYKIGFAPEAIVSSEDMLTLKTQLKQSYRWYTGTAQVIFLHRRIFGAKSKAKSLAYLSVLPSLMESAMYAIAILLLPVMLYLAPIYAIYFLIGDTILSFISPLIAPLLSGEPEQIPWEFFHTLRHYHQITAYKILASALFLISALKVNFDIIQGKQKNWVNKW